MAKTARGAAESARSSTKRRGAKAAKAAPEDPETTGSEPSAGTDALDFETALGRLEETVGALEAGELPLERALELFETGVSLSQQCLETLDAAERRIEILVARSGGEGGAEALDVEPFDEVDEEVDDEDFED